ncbi:hypothetical protein [Pseudomonas sp.]|uniref:hypothetical protein n=1 Tax=Pseudomonas sp. TaxID=306 RepID=UPI0028B0746E|nr:hypothetical protein [Pseudomonas sp.]
MDDVAREAHLAALQQAARGPSETFFLHESSLSRAIACAVLAVGSALLGIWLMQVTMTLSAQTSKGLNLLMWGVALAFLLLGLAGLTLAEALRQRHGQCVLTAKRDTLSFANASEPVPWTAFDGFDVDRRYLTTSLVFSVSGGSALPPLQSAGFESLVAPHVQRIAGGLRLRVWMCSPTAENKPLDLDDLTQRLFPYLEAAQARRTLDKLYPAAEWLGAPR